MQLSACCVQSLLSPMYSLRHRRHPCPPRLPLPQLSQTIGASGEPSDDDDKDDPTGEHRLLAGRASQHQLHHDVFVVLVIPNCLRHRRHRCRPPKMPISKLV